MAQVVTNENIVELHTTGKVPEFKAPEAPKQDEGKANGAASDAAKESAASGSVQPRDAGGKFASPSGEKSPPEKSKDGQAAPKPAESKFDLAKLQRINDIQKELAELDPEGELLNDHGKRVIGKKHRQAKEAEEFARERDREAAAERARAETLQRELDALRGKKSGQGPAAGGSDADDDAEPKPEDFKTIGEYTRALTKYEVAKAAKAAGEAGKRQSEQEQQQAQANATIDTFAQRQTEFMKTTPDYEEVVGESELDVPNAGMQYIVESEMGPQLAYHLAKNPGEVDRLRKLSPTRVVAELGKLEARLEAAATTKTDPQPKQDPPPQQQPRQVSRAPAPIQPLGGDAATPVHKDPKDMTFQELRAHRMAEQRAGKRV